MYRRAIVILFCLLLSLGGSLAQNTTIPTDASITNIPLDSDQDGVIDERDACPGTPPGSIIVDPFKNLEYAGCTCEQVRSLIDTTNPCIDLYCFQTLLQIRYDAVGSTFVECPEDYCDGYTYHDYPKGGYTSCIEGQLREYRCEPTLIGNATICGYVPPLLVEETTSGNEDANVSITTFTPANSSVDTITPVHEESFTAADAAPLSTSRYYLTDATMNYSYPATITEGDVAFFRLQFTTARAGLSINPELALADGIILPLLQVNCTDINATYACIGTWELPADRERQEDMNLLISYTTPEGTINENIAVPLTVKERPFAVQPAPTPIITGLDPQEALLIRAIYDEYAEQEQPLIKDIDEFLLKMQKTATHVLTEKTAVYDHERDMTRIVITITPNKGIIANNITIIEYIPKEAARSVSDITFATPPTAVLNDDPLVMWHFAVVDEDIDLSYELKGDVPVTGNTITIADQLKNKQSPWLIAIPMLMIPLLVILFLLVPRTIARHER